MSKSEIPNFLDSLSNFTSSSSSFLDIKDKQEIQKIKTSKKSNKEISDNFLDKLKIFTDKLDENKQSKQNQENQIKKDKENQENIIDNFSKKFELPIFPSDTITENLVIDMLCSIKTEDHKLRTKISETLKELGYLENQSTSSPSTILISESSTLSDNKNNQDNNQNDVFETAARRVAKILDLNFLINPVDSYKITEKDFVYASIKFEDFLNTQSKKINLEKAEDLVSKSLYKITKAQAGVFLFDGLHLANTKSQNMVYSLIQPEKTLHGRKIENIYIGMSTNLKNKITQDKQDYEELPEWIKDSSQTYIVSQNENKPTPSFKI